jgi:hypothetical protein
MEAATEPTRSNKAKKNLSGELKSLKHSFGRLGDLKRKLKSAKSAVEKKEITSRHRYDLNAIRKDIRAFKKDIEAAGDDKTYRELLTWERQRNIIGVSDEYALNKMEADTLEESCECHNSAPAAFHCALGGNYKHTSYFDDARQKEMYVTYIPVTIAPESQIGQELSWKMAQGFMPSMEDYPKAKILWHRRTLVESEWQRYFREI